MLHLSDLHASWAVALSTIRTAISEGVRHQPDLVVLTGDFITHRDDFDSRAYVKVLSELSPHPTFAVLGNHDGGSWSKARRGYDDHSLVERMLAEANITLMHNRSQYVTIRGRKLAIVGVGDLWSRELDAQRAFADAEPGAPTLLLSHNPDSKESVRSFQWDLMLSGHTHGGQVIVPFEGPRYAPVTDRRFVAGLHRWEDRRLYVTRGVGSLGSVRFMCRPEITILDVEV